MISFLRSVRLSLCTVAFLWAGTAAAEVKIEVVKSLSGIEAWLVHDPSLPIISLEAAFIGGASTEKEGKTGVATMVSALLDEGAGPYDSQAFQNRLQNLAIQMSFSAGRDSFYVSLKTLRENREEAFALLGSALADPRFSDSEVEKIRAQIMASIAQKSQNPGSVAADAWNRHIFGISAYGNPLLGTAETVAALTVDDLRQYQKANLALHGLKIAVVGDIKASELQTLLNAAFAGLPAGEAQMIHASRGTFDGAIQVIEKDNPQSVAIFGGPGFLRSDPDWYAAYTLNYILGGGGFSSRLTEEVREKRGLTYSVSTSLQPLLRAGTIIGSVSTRNDAMRTSLVIIAKEWERMRAEGPTQEELDTAKTYLIGSFPLQLTSTDDLASILLSAQVYDLGIDLLDKRTERISALTRDDLKRVAQRLLKPELLTTVIVGKPEGIVTGSTIKGDKIIAPGKSSK